MTIKGLETAIEIAIERANRADATICVVQIDRNEYVLWRENNVSSIPLVYPHYRIVKIVRISHNDIR